MELLTPRLDLLAHYLDALERGWSPNNIDSERHRLRELRQIASDPSLFVQHLTDPEAKAGEVQLPDGSYVPRLPGIRKWMWDGRFCGTIGLRWAKGTQDLPPHLMGHIGFSVVPWKQGCGYAAKAVRQIMPAARDVGLRWLTITADEDNLPSRKTIENAGAKLLGAFPKPAAYDDGKPILWYRIDL